MMYFNSLFFLTMLFQGAQSQDLFCRKFETIADNNAGKIEDVLEALAGGSQSLSVVSNVSPYDRYTIDFKEPTFDGCTATILADITVFDDATSAADPTGTVTIKGTFDYAALGEGDLCITDITVDLNVVGLPTNIATIIEGLIEDDIDADELCAPIDEE
jgi:hypothetical protein